MCYNNEYNIAIESCVNGVVSTVFAKGKMEKMPCGIRYDYVLDGDACSLTVNENEAVQSRRGGQNIRMTFRKGLTTECNLSSGGFSGVFTVFTEELKFAQAPVAVLFISYMLGDQKIELKFSAENINQG